MNWTFIANNESIKSKRRSILFDSRNHGYSDHHDSHTYDELAEDIIRNLDKLKIGKITLLGHSMGMQIYNIKLSYINILNPIIKVLKLL